MIVKRPMQAMAVTNRRRRAWKAPALALVALLALAVSALPSPLAAAGGIAVVRDAETEALIHDYLTPLLKAAGVSLPDVFLVPDHSFNAFVAVGRKLFVNVGTIIDSETPNQLIGVLAHEVGHLAGDDPAYMMQVIADAKTAALIGSLIGVGAAAAGSISGSQTSAQAGVGILSAVGPIVQRSLLSQQRVLEAAADRAAISYLARSGQSGAGMIQTLDRLARDDLFGPAKPYLRSHPGARERIAAIDQAARASNAFGRTDPPALQARHDLIRAKLIGFTYPPLEVNRRFQVGDNSLAAKYARAISAYRSGKPGPAVALIDELIAARPRYPYFHELKGQALLESGHPQAAIEPLRNAVALAPRAGHLRVMLGQALVDSGNPGHANEAVDALINGLRSEPDMIPGYRALARAYELRGDRALAQLTVAEGLIRSGNVKDAKAQAARAQANLKPGSPAWLRADDILSYKPPK